MRLPGSRQLTDAHHVLPGKGLGAPGSGLGALRVPVRVACWKILTKERSNPRLPFPFLSANGSPISFPVSDRPWSPAPQLPTHHTQTVFFGSLEHAEPVPAAHLHSLDRPSLLRSYVSCSLAPTDFAEQPLHITRLLGWRGAKLQPELRTPGPFLRILLACSALNCAL